MKYLKFCLPFCLATLFFSCALLPVREASQERTPPAQVAVWAFLARPDIVEPPQAPEIPEPEEIPGLPRIPRYIMGTGILHSVDLTAFLLNGNPGADINFVEALAVFYVEEAAVEGVNHDVAFAQMILETGFLRFGGLVTPEMNNFAGLGSIGPGQHGLWFPDPRTGVRAHIQHLKAYACTQPLNQELVNPRFRFVTRGSAPTIRGLTGTWAADPLYDVKINNILERMYRFTFGTSGF